MRIGTPCLIFSTLTRADIALAEMGVMVLAGLVIPAMPLLLGVTLSQLKTADLRLASAMALMRIAVGALAALVMVLILGLSRAEAGVVWIMATMPAAVVNVIFSERYGRSPKRVAGVIVVFTVGTLAALPLVVWTAMQLAA